MGIRIRVADREPIGLALRRLRKLLERNGVAREIRDHACFVKDSDIQRRKKYRKWLKSRQATHFAKCAGER